MVDKPVIGKKYRVVHLSEAGPLDWDMTDEEYETLLAHEGREVVVDCDSVDWEYFSVTFDDGYEIDALHKYHLEELDD